MKTKPHFAALDGARGLTLILAGIAAWLGVSAAFLWGGGGIETFPAYVPSILMWGLTLANLVRGEALWRRGIDRSAPLWQQGRIEFTAIPFAMVCALAWVNTDAAVWMAIAPTVVGLVNFVLGSKWIKAARMASA